MQNVTLTRNVTTFHAKCKNVLTRNATTFLRKMKQYFNAKGNNQDVKAMKYLRDLYKEKNLPVVTKIYVK